LTLFHFRFQLVPEITCNCKGTPYVLDGTRTELRNNETIMPELAEAKQSLITHSQGVELAKELGAVKYLVFSFHTCNYLTKIKLA